MATTKKTHTTKKVPVTKRPVAKKTVKKVKARPLTWRFYVVTIGIYIIAVTTVIVIGFLTAHMVAKNSSAQRLDRINQIYSSLNLSDQYAVQSTDVFGEKRTYSWDKDRTKASTVTYIRGDTVSNTVAELDAKIKAAGFTYVETDALTSKDAQYRYKSAEGEYVNVRVVSKPYRDALENASAMSMNPESQAIQNMDKNAGPSRVIIRVNLDDSNE
jgi:hypothetical protein